MGRGVLGWVPVVVTLAAALPVGAAPPEVSGSAYGVSVTSSLLGSLLGPTPAGVAGSATAPNAGFHHSAEVGPISLANVLAIGALSATTAGTIDPRTGERAATSTVTVADISVLNGLVTGAAVTATCTSGGASGRPGGSSSLVQLTLGGTAQVGTPPPNTVIGVAGVLSAVLNEQTPIATPHGPGIQVRAVDLEVLPSAPGGALLSVVIGQADCGAGGALTPSPSPGFRLPPLALAAPSPSASPSPSPSPSPLPSPTATAAPPPPRAPPAAVPTLVLSPLNGPSGSTFSVLATRYSGCPRVYILLGQAQLGYGSPSASGRLSIAGLTIPGALAPGRYTVYARCSSASVRERLASFTVASASLHRSAFDTSVPTPQQVSLAPKTVGQSAAVGGGFLLVGAFPGELFNGALAENYDEVRGWFGLSPVKEREPNRWRELAIFIGFILVGGVLDSALSADFGWNLSTLSLATGFAAALVVLMLVYSLPLLIHIRSRHGEWGVLKVLPGTAIVAAACVILSRAVHFEPGYLLGLVAGLEFGRELAADTTGRLTLLAAGLTLGLGVVAWFAHTPVSHAASLPHASFGVITLSNGLSAFFIAALESTVFTLLPLRFLEGKKLTDWRRLAWAAIFGVATVAFINILLQPTSGYRNPDAGAAKWTAVALFVGFGLFSVAFWAYFRFRAPRGEAVRA
ncbi:MAG TPA: choice-of-anchor P family protein [Actinomycetota bacterium]|nr:choice-of-anchor P family protein [Actinomycetota bacterium]